MKQLLLTVNPKSTVSGSTPNIIRSYRLYIMISGLQKTEDRFGRNAERLLRKFLIISTSGNYLNAGGLQIPLNSFAEAHKSKLQNRMWKKIQGHGQNFFRSTTQAKN